MTLLSDSSVLSPLHSVTEDFSHKSHSIGDLDPMSLVRLYIEDANKVYMRWACYLYGYSTTGVHQYTGWGHQMINRGNPWFIVEMVNLIMIFLRGSSCLKYMTCIQKFEAINVKITLETSNL